MLAKKATAFGSCAQIWSKAGMTITQLEFVRLRCLRMLSGLGSIGVEVGVGAIGGYNATGVIAYRLTRSCTIIPRV